jgi:hypothetical protein
VQVYGTFWTPGKPGGGGFTSSGTCPKCGADYAAAQASAYGSFGINTRDGAVPASTTNPKAYIDIRGALTSPTTIAAAIQAIAKAGPVANVYVVSLGGATFPLQ